METRNISITLDKAVEWYAKGDEAIKKALLEAFSEDELGIDYKNIKCFEDVAKRYPSDKLKQIFENVFDENQKALLKVNLIRKTLNKDYVMRPTEGPIYYPIIPLVTLKSKYFDDEIKDGKKKVVAKVFIDGMEYKLLGGGAGYCGMDGLLSNYSYGGVFHTFPSAGFLGCATKQIAKHMSLYFAKEIFDAQYRGWLDYYYAK